jgi:two-component system sensor histidine kinase BaeS
MIRRSRTRGRYYRPMPAWWPEGEQWPPFDPGLRWRRRRYGFMRRAWILVALVWWLSGIGAFSIFSRVSDRSVFWTGDRLWSLGIVAVIGLFAVSLVVFVTRVMSPIGDIVGAAHRVADGDLSARVPEKGPPAVRAVATAFNDMAERLARQEKQRRELMADIAHELRTPLSVVQGRLEGLIDGVYPSDASHLEPLLEETRVLTRIVDDLRTLANAESGVLTLEKESTDIGMLLRDAADAVHDEAARKSTTISVAEDPSAPVVVVDPVRMRQVIVNLLANAVRHGGGSAVTAEARVDAGTLIVRVADTGPGIPADELPHIFDRFYKRRGSSGSGLGLTIARTLVRAHGGEITVTSGSGRGSTFTITIPTQRVG